MNRQYLARALALGFREVAISDAEKPLLCDDGRQQYVWSALEKGDALAPSQMAVTIQSPDAPVSRSSSAKPRTPVASETVATEPAASPGPVNRIASIPMITNSPEVDLITQAEQVRESLRTTLQAVGTLIGAARQQRKQSRLTKSALASLKQLQTLRLE